MPLGGERASGADVAVAEEHSIGGVIDQYHAAEMWFQQSGNGAEPQVPEGSDGILFHVEVCAREMVGQLLVQCRADPRHPFRRLPFGTIMGMEYVFRPAGGIAGDQCSGQCDAHRHQASIGFEVEPHVHIRHGIGTEILVVGIPMVMYPVQIGIMRVAVQIGAIHPVHHPLAEPMVASGDARYFLFHAGGEVGRVVRLYPCMVDHCRSEADRLEVLHFDQFDGDEHVLDGAQPALRVSVGRILVMIPNDHAG